MPLDSNWKTPTVSAVRRSSKVRRVVEREVLEVELDRRGRASIASAFWITVSVRSPRKSILRRPIFSTAPMSYWVVTSSLCRLVAAARSRRARVGVMTTPAAWVEAWRDSPSRVRPVRESLS